MHSLRLLIGVLVAVLAAGGARAGPRAVGAVTGGTFTSPEGTRSFGLFRPLTPLRAGEERALVVVLHGGGESPRASDRGTRMNEAAARDGFVVLYPEQPASAHPQRCWNWYV